MESVACNYLQSPLGAIDSEQASADRRVRLKSWSRRTARSLGYRTPDDRPPPLIDQAHRLMHFWRAAEEAKVNKITGLVQLVVVEKGGGTCSA